MPRQEQMYDDVLDFLKRVEDPNRSKMNRRTRISNREADALRKQFHGVPDEYVAYLREVGWGSFRECQFMIYSGLGTADEMLGEGTFDWLKSKSTVLCFGDNFSGDLAGFVPDENWAVVELWHDAHRMHRANKSFGHYIREKMLMDGEGA